MRSSRLLAVLLALQRHERSTAPALAQELEVSVRTIYRDVRALQDSGVPVWTETGPAGGIRLMRGWKSPVEGMTGAEISALMFGPAGAADLGMATVLATARSKVRSGLPTAAMAQIDAITERFHLDEHGWFRDHSPGEFLPIVASAVWDGVRLDLRYQAGGRTKSRRVDPLGLVLKAGIWYLVAAHRGSLRTYRVQRIASAAPRDEPVHRPEGFDLAVYWAGVGTELDRSIRGMPAILRIPTSSLPQLRRHVPGVLTGEAIDAATPTADGRVTVSILLESVEVGIDQLALVRDIEVVEPPELRQGMRELADQLARANN